MVPGGARMAVGTWRAVRVAAAGTVARSGGDFRPLGSGGVARHRGGNGLRAMAKQIYTERTRAFRHAGRLHDDVRDELQVTS